MMATLAFNGLSCKIFEENQLIQQNFFVRQNFTRSLTLVREEIFQNLVLQIRTKLNAVAAKITYTVALNS